MDLDRRRLVQAALLAALCPSAWAGDSRGRPIKAWRKEAIESARPLLVLLVPDDPHERYRRGRLFGALLQHGDLRSLASLGRCVAVCAAPSEVERALPGPELLPPDAWFVLMRGDEVQIGAISPPAGPSEDEELLHGMEQLEAALVAAIGAPPDADVSHLALLARAGWVEGEVPGSRWLSFDGSCAHSGYRPERPTLGERLERFAQSIQIGMCGRAHVSALATRMLEFY